MGQAAVGYVRSGAGGDPTADEQRRRIKAYAGFRGLKLAAVHADEDVPGGVPLAARPGGAALVARLRDDDARGLVVCALRLELLFSSATECVVHEAEWRAREAELHVLDLAGNPVSSATLEGRFMMSVLEAARSMERLPTRDRGHPPPHRDRARLGERVVRGYVVPDTDELRAVRRIAELAGGGASLGGIARALDEEGVPTKRRARAWSKEAIRLILRRIERGDVPSLLRPDGKTHDGTPA